MNSNKELIRLQEEFVNFILVNESWKLLKKSMSGLFALESNREAVANIDKVSGE